MGTVPHLPEAKKSVYRQAELQQLLDNAGGLLLLFTKNSGIN
jgi:hypothetical protein